MEVLRDHYLIVRQRGNGKLRQGHRFASHELLLDKQRQRVRVQRKRFGWSQGLMDADSQSADARAIATRPRGSGNMRATSERLTSVSFWP